jgi:hypothetical protein
MDPRIRFGVIGINYGHIYGQVGLLLNAGAEFVAFYAKEPECFWLTKRETPTVLNSFKIY